MRGEITMSKLKWVIQYVKNTGESHEHGWIDSEGTEWALWDQDGHHPEILDKARAEEFYHTGSLCDLLQEADNYDCLERHPEYDCLHTPNRPWSDSLAEFQLYVEGVTEATKKRIYRLVDSNN
jgi:hypothetical protein